MKKLKLNLDGVREKLTREQMKNVTGGYGNPNCSGSGYDNWYCCTSAGSGTGTYIGYTYCTFASASCSGYMITNNPSRC